MSAAACQVAPPIYYHCCRFCVKTYGGHREWVKSVKVSPDGALLASCSNDQVIYIV